MGLFTNPLGHAGYPPGVTGTPETQPSAVRAATVAEVEAGTIDYAYVSPATFSAGSAADFASPPAIGNTTPNTGAFTTLHATGNLTLSGAGTGIVTVPTVGTTGAGPITATGRVFKATFSSVSIASGATQAFVITNTDITTSSIFHLDWYGATAGSALSIESAVPTTNTLTITMTNGTSATMVTSVANITFVGILLN